MNPSRYAYALIVLVGAVVSVATLPSAGAPVPSMDPLRPTFSGAVVASRTTTVGPGGMIGGTRVGGALGAELVDVTGDGEVDLVATGRAGDSVAGTPAVFVYPGRGDGSFDPPLVTTCSASGASRILATDLNGDGDTDVVVGGPGTPATYAVLHGFDDGTFTEVGTFQVNTPSIVSGAGLVAGRFDGDAHPDLAIVATGGRIAVLLGGAAVGFGSPTYFGGGGSADDVSAADLDGDGALDLVVADRTRSTLALFAGDGNGNFAPLAPVAAGTTPRRVLAVDVVGDAFPDLIATGTGTSILRGTGGFAFTGAFSSPAGGSGHPAVLDVDGDSKPDLVLGIPGPVFLGDGVGGFAAAAPGLFLADTGSFGAPVAPPVDLDRDGRLDVVTLSGGGAVSADRSLTPLLGRGNRVQNPRVISPGGPAIGTPVGVVLADVDGDGFDDVATAFTSVVDGVSYVSITYSTANGPGSGPALLLPIGGALAANVIPAAIAAGDFDGDGTDEIVVANGLASALPVQLAVLFGSRNRQPGSFVHLPSNIPAVAGFAGLAAVSVADIDGDGKPDIVGFQVGGGVPPALTPSQATLYRFSGAGGFVPTGVVPASRTNSLDVPAADIDGDGRADLVLRTSSTTLAILPGQANGTFAAPVPAVIPASLGAGSGDLDGDGRADIVLFFLAGAGWDVAWARSLGGFALGTPILSVTGTPDAGGNTLGSALAFGDFNGDGLTDLATDGTVGADLGVFVQRLDGTFVHVSLATLVDQSGIAAGDLDGDGRLDLVNVGRVGGSPILHEWFLNTTLDAPEIRDADRRKARRGEIVPVDCRLHNLRSGFIADFGSRIEVFHRESRGDDRWRLHVFVHADAVPGERALVVVRPDGDEGATGRDGARSAPREGVLRVLEDGIEPLIRKLSYPTRSKGYLPAGHEEFRLKLKGKGFGGGAVVYFDGHAMDTRDPYKKGKRIKAVIPAKRVSGPGIYEVILVNRLGPPSNAVFLVVIGPEIEKGKSRWRDDGTLRVEVRGRNMRREGFSATVRRLDTGAVVPMVKIKRSSKKKVKLTLDPASELAPGTDLEVIVSYEGSLGNRIESMPFVLPSP